MDARLRPTVVLGAALVAAASIASIVLWRQDVTVKFVALAVLFVPVERLLFARTQRIMRPGWRTDVAHFILTPFIVAVIVGVPIRAADSLMATGPGQRVTDALAAQPGWLRIIEAIVVLCLLDYWAHRLHHSSKLLWRFHSVHHGAQHMDWLMSARFHPVNAAVVTVLVTVPLRMLGFAFAVAGAAGLVMYALNLFEHANVRIDVPGLRWIVPNPAFHHWHHAVDTPNCNYGQFPFVDAIFGTAHLPKDARPSVFGLHEPVPNEGYVEQLLHPLRRPAPQALAVARGDAG